MYSTLKFQFLPNFATWEETVYEQPTIEELLGPDQPNRTVVTLPMVDLYANESNDDNKGSVETAKSSVEKDESSVETAKSSAEINGLKLNETQKNILRMIRNNNKSTASEMAKELSLSVRAVEKSIKELREAGIVERKGPTKVGSWVIDKNPKI